MGTQANAPHITLGIGSDVEIAKLVTADLEKQLGQLVACEGEIWRYDRTHWVAIPEEVLWLAADRYDGALFHTPDGKPQAVKLNKGRLSSVLACMRPAITRRDFFDAGPVGINCSSGFIRFNKHGDARLEQHSPDHRCRHVLPGCWPMSLSDEQRKSSLFAQLLDGCFDGDNDKQDKIDLLGEVAGMAALGFATKTISPKALVLKGEKAENGKSQVLDALRALLPKSAVSSISPSKFHDRTFVCHLAGKLLNVSDELSSGEAIASEAFKMIIAGEPVTARLQEHCRFSARCAACVCHQQLAAL
jgi:phage/plasmid-associated DNA primase